MEALASSLNVPTVNLGMQVGWTRWWTPCKLGVEREIQPYPSLVLGRWRCRPWR